MEKCKFEVVLPAQKIDTRKKTVLAKISEYKKLSILRKILNNLKNDNISSTSIEDTIASNYSYIFDDLNMNKYSQNINDNIEMSVSWWEYQLTNNRNTDANEEIFKIDESNIQLFKKYLAKIIVYQVFETGHCIISTDISNNEPLLVARFLSGIEMEFTNYGSMFIDKEGTVFDGNRETSDYSQLKTKKKRFIK